MPEFQPPQSAETKTCANIQKMVTQLNGELKAAHEQGLRVYVGTLGILASGPERLSVRVWREIELLREPPSEPRAVLGAAGPTVEV